LATVPGAFATTAATSGLFGSAGAFSLGSTFSTLSSGLGIFGSLASASQQSANLEYQAQMAEYRRKVGENNALAIEYQKAIDIDLFDDKLKRVLATQETGFAKSNVLINQDTPLDIHTTTVAEGAAEKLAIGYNADVAAQAARLGAESESFAARNLRANASGAQTAGFINAAAGTTKFFGTGAGRGLLS
jgi:hypothetical protein